MEDPIPTNRRVQSVYRDVFDEDVSEIEIKEQEQPDNDRDGLTLLPNAITNGDNCVDSGEEVNSGSITTSPQQEQAVGFLQALMIPGVIEYSLSLFFNKLVSYTFLFWLPFYVQVTRT